MKKKLSLMMICFLGLVSFVFAAAFEPTNATETIELTKANIESLDYLSVTTDNWAVGKTYGDVTGDFYNMSKSERQLKIDVQGVSKFEVFVQNGTADRHYTITVGDGTPKSIAHEGKKVESSGEIETGTTDATTITLAGVDGSVYPVKIVLTKAENSSEPSLSVSPKTLEFTLTPSKTKAEESFTLTGKNLKDGTYNLTVPNLAGLTVAPTSFTVAGGAVEQQFTVTYESTANIAKATTDITATVGDLSASVAVTYQSRATANTQSTVKEAATWDWSQLTETVQLSAETTPKQTEEFLLADLDDRITFTEGFGDATAIVMKDMQYPSRGGYAQGNIIKFKTSVAGTIDVDFSNTGDSRPYRHLYVNGKPTTSKSGNNTKVSATGIEVAAGEIELKGYIPDAKDPVARDADTEGDAMLRWYKISFTPKTDEQGGETSSNWKDIKADLTQLQDLATESNVYIKVGEDGAISKTENADEAAATLKGKWHGTAYGWSNFTAAVPVQGCVKITYATHDYGNDIVVTDDAGAEVAKFNTKGAKWSSDPSNVVVAYYRNNTPTTLHFSNAQYNPYFAVEAIAEADLPAEVTKYHVNFAAGDGATGTAPAAVEVEAGSKMNAPKNYTLYKEGYTLTGWSDGSKTYATGAEIAPEADMTLTAVFTENEVKLADRTEAVTISYALDGNKENPQYKYEGNTGIIVTQATVNGKVIDVKADVDATSGKFSANGSGWHQVNTGTKVTVPSCKGATITVKTYQNANGLKFGETAAEADADPASYTSTSEDASLVIEQTSNGYWNALSIILPVVEGGDEPGDEPVATDVTATWDFSNENVMADAVALSASSGTVKAVEDNGILLTVEANNATFRNNGNNIQVREGAVFKVPVKNAGDEVIVKGYPNYSSYTVGNITVESLNGNGATSDATYKAKASDATQGYVTITSNNNNNYFYSIKVIQYAPKEAETLDNQAVTATFPFDSGAAGQKATFSGDYFLNSKVVAGDNMGYYGVRTIDSKAFTGIQPKADTKEAAGEGDYMTFIIQPKPGFIFTPTKVSLNASKYGTGNGTIDVLWQNTDGTTVTLDEGKGVARNNETPAYSSFEYQDLSKATPGEGACGVRVNIYGKLAANKQLCLRDIVIEGTLSGTEKEVPILESFKINNTEYQIEDVFGEDYEATLKLSKSEKMVNENNPLTDVTATSGEIGAITYTESTETGCKVTIPVAAGETTMNYILNIIQKPDYTLSYIDVDGNTVLDTQVLEEDSKIGEFKVNIADVKAATEGYKARGWFKLYSVGEKYTTEEIVTSDLNLYAVETEIEVSSDSRKYEFDLKDKNFYAEDHEAFNVTSEKAKWHDNTHGWAFYNGDKIDLLVGAKATISIAVCKYGAATNILVKDAQGNTLETLDGMNADSDGALVAYNYEGEPGTLTLEMVASGEMYIHSVKIVNTNVTNYTNEGNWYFVKPGDASSLIDVIDVVNGQNAATDAPRSYIYLPNGTYDLKETVLTTIGGHNISLIGESQEGVIIKNAPHYTKESINNTATLKNTGTGNYFQDLTIQNALDYYGAQAAGLDGGRAVALWDTGTKTICKNVKMLSYQDTYYTNNANGEYYWETSDIHGTVDFICGEGTLFMENSTLTLEKRKADGSGENTLTAPSTGADKTIGYVFNNCTIDNTCGSSYNLGRAWNNAPRCAYINTTMTNAEKLSANRWTLKGMNTEPAKAFVEYNTKDANNVVISPKSHIVTFTASKSDKTNPDFETILTDEQAAEFTVDKVFGEWKPADAAKQIETPEAELKDGTISWTNVEGNAGYAIYADGELLAITDKDATSYIIETANESAANRAESTVEYTIRAINAMGGLGNVKTVSVITGINKINADIIDGNAVVYDLQGRRVNNATKGVFIVNGKKVIVK